MANSVENLMRNPDLAGAILEDLYARRDAAILSHDLKSSAPQFSVVPENEWGEALSDLRLAGFVEDELIPSEDAGELTLHSSLQISRSGFEEISQLKEVEVYATPRFRDWSEPLYSDLDVVGADIREEYTHRGALRSSSYYRAVAKLILERLRGFERAFIVSYLRPIEERTAAGVDALRERWLLRRLDNLWKPELERASATAAATKGICSRAFWPSAPSSKEWQSSTGGTWCTATSSRKTSSCALTVVSSLETSA